MIVQNKCDNLGCSHADEQSCWFKELRKPAPNKLILCKIEDERVSKGGIVFAESFESPTQKAIICAVGECKGSFNVNDYAYIQRHAGFDIGFDEIVVREEEILYTMLGK